MPRKSNSSTAKPATPAGTACGIALERLKASGVDLDKLPEVKISLGSKAGLEDSKGCVQVPIGNCQNQYKHLPNFVPGCPPPTFLMADQIREMLGEKRKFGPKKDFFMDK